MGGVLVVFAISTHAQNSAITINVDAAANRRPINANVYGVAHATTAQLNDLNTPLIGTGGNNTTRYNWQVNADNRGSDWYFESIAENSAVAGERGDTFITNSRAASAQPMLTIPMIDWVAKVGAGRGKLASFSVAKYGAQADADWQWFADAGNGVLTNGQRISGNDPNDANVPSNALFQRAWCSIWSIAGARTPAAVSATTSSTTSRACGRRPTRRASDRRDDGRNPEQDADTARRSRQSIRPRSSPDPRSGAGADLFSGFDLQHGGAHGWSVLPDRNNHGGSDYLPWLSTPCARTTRQADSACLTFTVHYYPQGGEFSDDGRARCSCGATVQRVRSGILLT